MPFASSSPLIEGAAAGLASASANDAPLSSISHTLVIGGTLEVLDGLVVFGAGAGVSVGAAAAGVVVCAGAAAAGAGVGVACAVIAGGELGVVAAGAGAGARLCAATPASSAGSFCAMPTPPASEASGPGPTAAPTAMPMPSMTVASTALARAEGRRARPGGSGLAAPVGAASSGGGVVEVSMDFLFEVERAGYRRVFNIKQVI